MFPSRKLMRKCYHKWEKLFERDCFLESKDKHRASLDIKKYIFKCEKGEKEGAILFSVFRGNYSEGYNFKNGLCRAVIMIGVPNLNWEGPKIRLKRKKHTWTGNY